MPRHDLPPLPLDPRPHRPSPDHLPSHRQCTRCAAILPLDSQTFYEVSTRFAWNLSRFGFQCIQCSCAGAERATPGAKIPQIQHDASGASGIRRFRRLEVQEFRRRRECVALLKRVNNRTYGTRPDAIKLMIKEDSEMYLRRRLELASVRLHVMTTEIAQNEEQTDYRALLAAMRIKHAKLG